MALIEGVMMRGPSRWAAAVRRPDGGISVVDGTVPGWAGRCGKLPLVRGVAALAESLSIGVRVLLWSAAIHEAGRKQDDAPVPEPRSVKVAPALAPALLIATVLFFVVPAGAAHLLAGNAGTAGFNAVETVVRLAVLVAYLFVVGRLPDIRRVFAYHGAEHKVVAHHETSDGRPLSVAGARACSTRHQRCGTTFLLVVIALSTVVHLFVGKPSLPWLLASRALLVPVVAALAYELITWVVRRPGGARRVLLAPGLVLQGLTTNEPDDDQLEVALVALAHALPEAASASAPAERVVALAGPPRAVGHRDPADAPH